MELDGMFVKACAACQYERLKGKKSHHIHATTCPRNKGMMSRGIGTTTKENVARREAAKLKRKNTEPLTDQEKGGSHSPTTKDDAIDFFKGTVNRRSKEITTTTTKDTELIQGHPILH